jgi:hypothetical protein
MLLATWFGFIRIFGEGAVKSMHTTALTARATEWRSVTPDLSVAVYDHFRPQRKYRGDCPLARMPGR